MATDDRAVVVRRWLLGRRRVVELLPGRPLDEAEGSAPAVGEPPRGPSADALDPSQPAQRRRAICCSGGGIRAAAFALGGMQALGRRPAGGRSWYDEVDLVTAVSGGSYMASSFAMVDHNLTAEQRARALPYAPGSPEDNRLRAHTRYLVEDPRVAALGILSVLYGLLLNLAPILAGLYVLAKVDGALLFKLGILHHSGGDWSVERIGTVAAISLGLAGVGLLLFAGERLRDVYRRPNSAVKSFLRTWSLRMFWLAAGFALAFLAVPELLRLLSTSSVDLHPSGVSWGTQAGSFLATVVALVALVKGSIGRFKAKLQTSVGTTGTIASLTSRALRWLAPWAGSAIAVAVLLLAFLSWTTSAAYDGLQWWPEWALMLLAVAGAVVWQACTDINRNSVHPFYKERLATAFAVHRVADWGDAPERADALDYSQAVRLSDYATAADGSHRPELVVCATVNTDEEGAVPTGRRCAPFTFSSVKTGISSGTMFDGEALASDDGLMQSTAAYEEAAGVRLMTLPAAVAVSGAAVSPAMGRMSRAPIRLLLGLANVRLGLWLPNPRRGLPTAPAADASWSELVRWQVRQPGMWSLLREILGRARLDRRWVYVTDGGHYENLGLVEALRRGATEIIVFDASGDTPHTWNAFGEAVETARADLGVQILLDPSGMAPAADSGRTPTMVVRGTCRYPNGVEARLILCKLALPVALPASWDVAAWSSGHPSFPNDSTTEQLYGDREFEAYRRLGELGGEEAVKMIMTEEVPVDSPADGFNIDLTVPVPVGSDGMKSLHVRGSITHLP
ncbi:MAG: hypothetical protein QOE01_3213 [Actinomycetota bacterium]|nr:hypothetical protein [Actinomycetota bacterium]